MSEMEMFDSVENTNSTDCQEEIFEKQRKATNSLGWRYAVMGLVVIVVQFFFSILLSAFEPVFYENNIGFVSLMLTLVSFDIIGTLTIYLLTCKMNKTEIEKKSMTIGQIFMAILISAGLCGVGAFVGTIVHMVLTLPFGQDGSTDLALIMLNSSLWLRVLVIGIGAPVLEEIIFRKWLIDRTIKYGEFFAIFLSGIFFGLFHGNFSQLFFATMLGFFFAFIYVKTGNVWYTILLHMVINMTSSVVTTYLAGGYMETIGDGSKEAIMAGLTENPLPFVLYLLWLGILGVICFAGLVVFIVTLVKKKYTLKPISENKYKGKTIYKTVFSYVFLLFFAMTLILFANAYVLPAIMSFVNAK